MTESQATSLAESFITTLRSAITSPSQEIAAIDKIGPRDMSSLLRWNQTEPERVNECVHTLIRAQADTCPDAEAVSSWDGSLTYKQLDDLSTRLASNLVSLGVGPEVYVLVCLERSRWTPVALLAVLKAGGAFIPIDPKLPPKRVADIAARAGATIALVDDITRPRVESTQVQTVLLPLTESCSSWSSVTQTLPDVVQPSNAAYIIYTSGSTGVPKGVVIEHVTLASSSRAHAKSMGISSTSRVLHFSSIAFDSSITEILTTLIQGGCVCIPSEAQRLGNTVAIMNDLRVNWAFFTPSFAATLVPDALPYLKTLVLGGEAMTARNIEDWADKVSLHNGYGPSETCVFAVSDRIPAETREPFLGRAIGSTAWVADADDANTLAPLGAIGELLIQGPIVGRGYLGDEELTCKMFLPPTTVPDIGHRQAMVYRTGDLVRYLEDGKLVYLGRKGSQVKLRGQRVELGEISHKIESIWPETERAVAEVVRPSDRSDSQMLVAFVQMQNTAVTAAVQESASVDSELPDWYTPTTPAFLQGMSKLRKLLSEVLPHYMVPQVFIPVRQIPLSLNGKAERAKLRDWAAGLGAEKLTELGQEQASSSASKRMPTSEAEIRLQGLWEEVLSLSSGSVGADDDFFKMGADSLHVLHLMSAAEKLGLRATMSEILDKPILSEMTLIFKEQQVHDEPQEVVPFEMLGDGDLDFDMSDEEFDDDDD